jgi:hypothetical protein
MMEVWEVSCGSALFPASLAWAVGFLFLFFSFLLYCDFGSNWTVKMSRRVKGASRGNAEEKKWKRLSLSFAQKVELLQKLHRGVLSQTLLGMLRNTWYMQHVSLYIRHSETRLVPAVWGGGLWTCIWCLLSESVLLLAFQLSGRIWRMWRWSLCA